MAKNKSVLLSSGHYMPLVGFGTWQVDDESEAEKAILAAIDAGYRHIDTAYVYKNEHLIGNVLKKIFQSGKIKREDIFIVTKLPGNGLRKENVEYFCKKSLSNLQLDYIDLYLIHTTISVQKTDDDEFMPVKDGKFLVDLEVDLVETWKSMEKLVDSGLVKSIGLSNFNSKQIQNIVDNSRIKPANLQVECHAYLPQFELHEFCKNLSIAFTAYSPLGSPALMEFARKKYGVVAEDTKPKLLLDPKLKPIAEKYNKTNAQILLRYLIQRDIIVIPKSSNPERIKQNIQIFDFELTKDEMEVLKSMKRDLRYFAFDFIPEMLTHPHFPFNVPY